MLGLLDINLINKTSGIFRKCSKKDIIHNSNKKLPSAVMRIKCFCREPGFGSLNQRGSSQPFVTPISGSAAPLLTSLGSCVRVLHIHTLNTHAYM